MARVLKRRRVAGADDADAGTLTLAKRQRAPRDRAGAGSDVLL